MSARFSGEEVYIKDTRFAVESEAGGGIVSEATEKVFVRPKGTPIYIAPTLNLWENLTNPAVGALNVSGTNAAGFCLFFESYEACRAEFPMLEPIRVEVIREHYGIPESG